MPANKRLIRLRLDIEYSIEDVAQALNIPPYRVRSFEAGTTNAWGSSGWDLDAQRLADFHGVGPEEIWSEGKADRADAEQEAAVRAKDNQG